MDVSLVTAPPPVTVSGRYGTESAGSAQAAPSTLDQAPSKITTPNSVSSQADTPGTDETRNTPSQNQLTQAIKQVNAAFSQGGQNLYASFEKDKLTGIHVVK